MPAYDELVVLSHLRWTWVWQRPQHLVSRLGRDVPTWFVEEPMPTDGVDAPRLTTAPDGAVTRVWWQVPGPARWAGFNDPGAAGYADAVADLFPPRPGRVVWLYTAMALPLAQRIEHDVLVYDVMDDLASFKGAAPELRLRHRAALRAADVVFTGGRSLHAGVAAVRRTGVHCFPSGVEPEHYASAVGLRPARRERPVAGYVGVVDERLDLGLVADLAAALPDWDVEIVGPVCKIDEADLPQASNLRWAGPRRYDELPGVMAGFDVALMPFALNEATRSISPTKTLEYLAAGLPVVSTRVPDVVADHAAWVDLADDGPSFAAACRRALDVDPAARRAATAEVLRHDHWDAIAARMGAAIAAAMTDGEGPEAVEAAGS
ncbi:MAG TPA: glycosyltransferase [Acidimicrobiales bacterium]